jgi:predicted AAA+ superfamily ATPase
MSILKPWRQVVTPHADIRQGKFDASVFAADLGEVLAGRGAIDYRDAKTFFSKTYLTHGLTQLLIDVMRRLGGSGKGEPVIQLQTAFGGGKTHTLLTVYHLHTKPNEVGKLPEIQQILSTAGLKNIPTVNVACLVGTALDAASERTFWGEMAYQLDGGKEGKLYGLVAENDRRKTAPGTNTLGKLLAASGPTLILLDEILVYLVKASGVTVGESSLRGNTLTFLQELSIAVSNCPNACMIATLTSQLGEFFGENAERTYESLEMVLGRVEKIRQTVEGAEIYEVIRRRLFDWPKDDEKRQAIEADARATAESYWDMYKKLGEDVPSACREIGYRDDILKAYPFHPELISVLYERWGTIPEFQRTRVVLRLLADVISDLYQSKDNEALIQSGSVNLGAAGVRGELIKHTGWGGTGHSVIDSDIAGKNAKAPEIDRQLGSEYAKESVSEKLARAVFMYSFSGGQQRGATLPQLRVAVLNPEMAPPFISDALDRMSKRLWYMYQDSGLYRFESRPNLNRILVDREEMVRSEPERVRDFAKQTLNDMIGDAVFRVYRYPEEDRDVADEPRLSLVVLDLDQRATEDGPTTETEKFVTQILKQHGKGFRKHANMLIFLAPDKDRASEVTDAARRLLALRNIDEDKATRRRLTDEQLKDLTGRLKEAEARLPAALATVYGYVLVPAKNKTLRCFDLGISGYSGKTTLSNRVAEKLTDEQQILDKLDPGILIGERFGLWPEDQDVINAKTLADYFTQLTHLPRLGNPSVLPDCLSKGVQRSLFAYALGDGEKRQFDTIRFNDKKVSALDCEVTETAWLLSPALAKRLIPEPEPEGKVTGGGVSGGTGTTVVTGAGATGTGSEGDDWVEGAGGVVIKKGERRLNRVRIDIKRLPWENWHDIYNEVILPLAHEGADVYCQVIVIAKGDAAIRENTVELGIKESLSQRDLQADIQTG